MPVLGRSVRSLIRRGLSTLRLPRRPLPHLPVYRVTTFDEYQQHAAAMAPEYERRIQRERSLATAHGDTFTAPGYCSACRRQSVFAVDYRYAYHVDGVRLPNWREHLVCQRCHLNNRVRATLHVLEQECGFHGRSTLYVTEQTTALFHWLHSAYPNVIGSEFLGDTVPFGAVNSAGLRNETLTGLTFPANSVDALLSFEVLEHIPDYPMALAEVLRVLRPGGCFLFTAPFNLQAAQTLIRAVVNQDNTITHLLEPEYHGDPLSADGVLCFQHFGWDLVTQMRALGFGPVAGWLYWSEEFAYLGREQIIFAAYKP